MKKSYLTLAAMAMIMASCSNEVLVDDSEMGGATDLAIGFSTFSDLSTKGDATVKTNLEFYHGTFDVYGSKISTVDQSISHIFVADKITYSNGATTPNDWTYSPYRYWDKQANYNFIAVAPSSNIVEYSIATGKEVGDAANDFVTVTGGYTLNGQNLQTTATTAEIVKGFTGIAPSTDTDIMTSANVPQSGSSVTASTVVNLTFKHILAKLNVTVAKASSLDAANVEVKSLEITGLEDHGTYSEKVYDATTKKSGWTSSVENSAYKLAYSGAQELNASTGAPYYFIESLVMPQGTATTDEVLTLKYTITTGTGTDTHEENYTYRMKLADAFADGFLDRCNYTLKFTIDPLVIKFDATATVWAEQTAVNKKID